MTTATYTADQLDSHMRRVLNDELSTATVALRFTSQYVGGQPASERGIRAYVEHHMHLTGDAADQAVKRIQGEEVRKDGEGDELKEVEVYGLNIIRRNADNQAWVGTWQVRAMLKQSASRLGLFAARGKVGSKGDMSEMMVVKPHGPSDKGAMQEIVIVDAAGKPFSENIHDRFMGSVSTPQGRKSIVCDSEIAPVGSQLHITVEWPSKRLKADDMAAVLGAGQRIGLGSVKSMEKGRFEVVSMTVE